MTIGLIKVLKIKEFKARYIGSSTYADKEKNSEYRNLLQYYHQPQSKFCRMKIHFIYTVNIMLLN